MVVGVGMALFRFTLEALRMMLSLALSIQDDGRGFVPARQPAEAGQRGLAGMQERITALQGSLDITSQLGLGTRIEAMFPWPPRTQQRARSTATHDL